MLAYENIEMGRRSLAKLAGYNFEIAGFGHGAPILGGAAFTIGASAPIFGLLGALVRYGHRTGSSLVRGQAWSWALTLFVFGLFMTGVDNWAHAGGFAGGYVAAVWLDPMKPERTDHMVLALACFAMTTASIAASLVGGLGLLR